MRPFETEADPFGGSAYQLSRPLADWLTKLAIFVNRRNEANRGVAHKPTKVAILDNGVLSISPLSKQADTEISAKTNEERTGSETTRTDVLGGMPANATPPAKKQRKEDDENSLLSRIKAGRSFVDGNLNFSPWQFPSDPHGTQMANLICAIDPFCEIYVARVAEDAFGIKAENVTKVYINTTVHCLLLYFICSCCCVLGLHESFLTTTDTLDRPFNGLWMKKST